MLPYVRVSTDDQAAYGYGLAAQEATLREAFKRRGWTFGELYRDEGITGTTLDRPALLAALELIASGKADGLVVAKLDRLSRSVVDFGMLLEWFTAAGAALVILDFDIDTTTPGGQLVAAVMAAVAAWEAQTISLRTREAKAAARAQGKPTGPPSVVDRPELAARIRGLRDEGLSMQAICDALNAEGVPTARGASVWRKSAVQSILGYRRVKARKRIANLPELTR
jgi:DNA invertase Pin-like site-specific DNA recombinase